MSKYNGYARKLNEAFLAAREEYTKAAEDYEKAVQEHKIAHQWRQEKHIGENARIMARAGLVLDDAKAVLEEVKTRVWPAFYDRRDELRRELAAELKKDGLSKPDDVDFAGLELLKSGVLTADEYEEFVGRYDGNAAMLKLVGKYAKEAADNIGENGDRKERARLNAVYLATGDGCTSVLREWDSLCEIANICSGKRWNRKADPEYISRMSAQWENLSTNAVENF